MSQLFASGGQSIGVSASASVPPMNTQDWSPLDWTSWIFLQSKGLLSLLQHHNLKASILWRSAFFIVQLSHPYMSTRKIIALTRQTFVGKVISLPFNMLSRLVITFFQGVSIFLFHGCNHHLNSATISTVFLSICHEVMGPDAMIFLLWMLSYKPTFYSPLSLSSTGSLVLHFRHKGGVICISEVIDISPGNLDSSLCFNHPRVFQDVLCI